MAESIVSIRLTRNLRYKLTYVKVFETFLESAQGAEMADLLNALIQTQQAAVSTLAAYLRRLDVSTQDMELNDKLIVQAAERHDRTSQLRFIYDGLERAVSWYRMQLVDKQMVGDPELTRLLIDLGEMEVTSLWRTEALMSLLRIPIKGKEKEPEVSPVVEPARQEVWRPRLMDDLGRPSWRGEQARRPAVPPKQRPKDRP